jgi:hypothetical protein
MLSLVVLVFAAPAQSGDGALPWSGGTSRIGRYEAAASRIATELAGGDISIECADPEHWRSLAAENGFDTALTWALTPLRATAGGVLEVAREQASFSPRACRLANAFMADPTELGARTCRHGTERRWRTVAADRHARRVLVRTPVLGECDDWASKLLAVHVLTHETMHLAGVIDEAAADCLGMQLDAYVARRLGASTAFARSMPREYWTYHYPAQDRRYRSRRCRSGGALDLFRDRAGWPTPDIYPADTRRRIASFAAGQNGASTGGVASAIPVGSDASLVRGVTGSSPAVR